MNDRPLSVNDVADLVLRYDGPHEPDQVIAATAVISELVRRVNNATRSPRALRYPPHVDRAVGTLRSALSGLHQTFEQIAARLEAFTSDPRVRHDNRGDAWDTSAQAADHLRGAADALRSVTGPLDQAIALTNHLGYDTSSPRTGRAGFPAPGTPAPAHARRSPSDPTTGGPVPPHGRPNGPTR